MPDRSQGFVEPGVHKWGVIKEKVRVQDVITNELIDEINRFDPDRAAAEAKAYQNAKLR